MRSMTAVLLIAVATSAAAQSDRAARFMEDCRDNHSRDTERVCDTRSFTLPATSSLTVDGRANGGVSVHGWDRSDIQVVAMIQANAESAADAQAMAKQINVLTNGAEIRAEGPRTDRHENWSVSFEVWAPRATALSLLANN